MSTLSNFKIIPNYGFPQSIDSVPGDTTCICNISQYSTTKTLLSWMKFIEWDIILTNVDSFIIKESNRINLFSLKSTDRSLTNLNVKTRRYLTHSLKKTQRFTRPFQQTTKLFFQSALIKVFKKIRDTLKLQISPFRLFLISFNANSITSF